MHTPKRVKCECCSNLSHLSLFYAHPNVRCHVREPTTRDSIGANRGTLPVPSLGCE